MPDVLANTWRQLVRRRLWPVALLLLAALAAVPFVVGRDAEPVALQPDPVPSETVEADDSVGEPIVAIAAAGDRDRRRRVLGGRKDPFAPAPEVRAAVRKAAISAAKQQQAKASTPAAENKAAAGSGGATAEAAPADDAKVPTVAPGAGGSTPVASPAPAPVVEPAPKKRTYPNNSLIVRFGDAASGDLKRAVLEPLEALPEADAETEAGPLLVYVGLSKDRKTAKFMVDASAEPVGDGTCEPQPACETLLLRRGDTEFFDVKDETGTIVAQYQLDLVDINAKRKPAAKQARRSVAKVSTVGRPGLVAGERRP
jgi:hypothetical protein